VIHNLQKNWPARFRDTGQCAEDVIVDKLAKLFGWDTGIHVRIKDFQEMPESLSFRLFPKLLVPEQRFAILFQLVDEGDRVEAQVRAGEFPATIAVALDLAALDVVDARTSEWLARFARVGAVSRRPDVRRVVRSRGGRDVRILEQPFLDRNLLVHVGGHQHNVHEAVMCDFADNVEELGQITIAEFVAIPNLR
jgi:hypothetical protein